MTAGGKTHSAQPAGGLIDCQLVRELLLTGHYDQVVAVLSAAQTRCAQTGDAFTAHILEMANHLALACRQCRQDAAWHLQAHQEAVDREQGLREQINAALRLIGTGPASSPVLRPGGLVNGSLAAGGAQAPARGPVGRLRLWQQILALVGQKRPRETTAPAQWEALLTATEQTSPESRGLPDVPAGQDVLTEPRSPDVTEQVSPAALDPYPMEQSKPDSPVLAVYCLGRFQIYQDDRPIEKLSSSKARSILKYLITHRESPVPKEVLMELFWPDLAPDAARNNLNVAVYGLRQALRQTHPSFSHVLFHDDCYLFHPDLSIWVDAVAFEEHVAAALALEKNGDLEGAIRVYRVAEELYQGDFMEEDRYEDWPALQRQRLQTKYLSLLQQSSRFYLQQGDYATCAAMCNKMLNVDPCHEQAHRRLMRCYSRQEQPYLAIRQYHLCVERLREELDASPLEKTVALYRQIRQGEPV